MEIPQDRDVSLVTEGHLMFRPHVIQSLRELGVRNGHPDSKSSSYNRGRRKEAGTVDGYVREVLKQVPQGQLASFK